MKRSRETLLSRQFHNLQFQESSAKASITFCFFTWKQNRFWCLVRKCVAGSGQVAIAAWWHPQPSCHRRAFPLCCADLAFYTCGKQTSGNSSNALKQPFFQPWKLISLCSSCAVFFRERAQMECFRPDSCYFPSSKVLRLSQSDVSAHDRRRELLGPDVVWQGFWVLDLRLGLCSRAICCSLHRRLAQEII